MLTIIGCGNANRCDDGVGVHVVQSLMREFGREFGGGGTEVRIIDGGTGGLEVMFQARGCTELIIVDACRSGSEPGAVFRVPGEEFDLEHAPTFTLHDFRWDHALVAGRRLFGDMFPSEVVVYLIEAGNLSFGLELSAPVSRSACKVIEEIADKVRRHAVS